MTTSAIYALIHKLEGWRGVVGQGRHQPRWSPAMVRHFERLGGTVRLHDPVLNIHTIGDRAQRGGDAERLARAVRRGGKQRRYGAHSYRDLLGDTARPGNGPQAGRARPILPSLFVVHFGSRAPGPASRTTPSCSARATRACSRTSTNTASCPQDFSIYLHHPTVTDPSLAPPGKSTFYALVPVANMGKLPIDWEAVGPLLEKRMLDEVGPAADPRHPRPHRHRSSTMPARFRADLNACGQRLQPGAAA
jgi:phytoene desaturase